MKRITSFILFTLITIITLASADNQVLVNPPSLKYSLISTLDEIYLSNVLVPEKWAKYYNEGRDERYQWLTETYAAFSDQEKKALIHIFETVNTWKLLDCVKALPDDSSVDVIKRTYAFSFAVPLSIKKDLNDLIDTFYTHHFKAYFEKESVHYIKLAEKLTLESGILPNPFDYISRWTGIFLGNYECDFYYTFRKVGAWGFNNHNIKISTIQCNVDTLEKLYSTPLHEYAHVFFQTFTKDSDFKELTERLKRVDSFYTKWENTPNLKSSYSWRGFCEENLVEGFAKYLRWRLDSNYAPEKGIYPLDFDFFNYLKSTGYSPQKDTLKSISYSFYETILRK